MKTHHGRIRNWRKHYVGDDAGLGYVIWGQFLDHPEFLGMIGHTSFVVAYDEVAGEIETRNSRYTLVS